MPRAAFPRTTLAVVVFLSGVAGLGYEVVWGRWLHSVFRASAWALAAILSAFMAGLALGSFSAGRLGHRLKIDLLWLVCHQSRVEAEKPEECWLERWFQALREEGVRALDKLREGVQTAIEKLGQGFLRQRRNAALHAALEGGELDGQEYYRELLRLVYRLIFLFVAEDRDALLDPAASEAAKDRYRRFYATRHLRGLADHHRGGPHGDLWQGLRLVMEKLGEGCEALALPALGSFLWRDGAIPHLSGCELGNEACWRRGEKRGTRYRVEPGSVLVARGGSTASTCILNEPIWKRVTRGLVNENQA